MKASIELSLYPLSGDYKERITAFILRLKAHQNFKVVTNGMSTQIFGEYDDLMDLMKNELKSEFSAHRTVAVLKITDGELSPESLPTNLR